MRFLAIAFVCLVGCVRQAGPTPLPPKDVVTASACTEACQRLVELDCPEGKEPDCVPACEQVALLGYIWTTQQSGPRCVVHAGTVPEVRLCNVRCEAE